MTDDDAILRLRSFEEGFLDRILVSIEALPPDVVGMIRYRDGEGAVGWDTASVYSALLWEAGTWLRVGELVGQLPPASALSASSLELADGLFREIYGQTAGLPDNDVFGDGIELDDESGELRDFADALLPAIEELTAERLAYLLVTRQDDDEHYRLAEQLSEFAGRVQADPFLVLRPDEADELAWLLEGYSSDVLDDAWPSSWRSNSAIDAALGEMPGGTALLEARDHAESALLDAASVWARARATVAETTTHRETAARVDGREQRRPFGLTR